MFEDINKVLLITDMDDTFLPASKIPSKENLAAIERFKQDGGKFSIATGRTLQASQLYFDDISVNSPAILYNGGLVYDINAKKQIYDAYLDKRAFEYTKEIIKNNPEVGCEVLTLDNVYVPQMTEFERRHCEICQVEPILCNLEDIPENWYKVLFADDKNNIQKLIDYIESEKYDGVDFIRSAPTYYEMLPRNITKGSALNKMRELCNMQDYTIIAVGDYNNDIEMVKNADIGICPSNANEEVKAAADIVLDVSCEQSAIAAVVEYIYSMLK